MSCLIPDDSLTDSQISFFQTRPTACLAFASNGVCCRNMQKLGHPCTGSSYWNSRSFPASFVYAARACRARLPAAILSLAILLRDLSTKACLGVACWGSKALHLHSGMGP